MRAFRDAFGGENQVVIDARETTDATYVEFDIDGDGDYEIETEWPTTTPDWNGDTYSPSYKVDAAGYDPVADDPWSVIIRFDKHNGDFMVLLGIAPANDPGNKFLEPVQNDFDSFNFKHPIDDDFTQEELLRHLAETNLQGARRVASQVRELVDDTQELLAEAENETRDEEDERFAVITDTQDELEQVEEIWVNVGNGLESLTVDTLLGGTGEDTIRRLQERSDEAVEVATRAHDRVANYNDTRNEEDERFLQIERNLSGIVARTKYLASETDNNYAWYE